MKPRKRKLRFSPNSGYARYCRPVFGRPWCPRARVSGTQNIGRASGARLSLSSASRRCSGQRLTRLSFDGLVRSALTNTDPEHRLSRADITKRIQGLLPGDLPARLDELTNGALALTTRRAQPPNELFFLNFSKATLAGPATGFFAAPQWMRSLLTVPRNCSGENGFCRNSTSPGTISSVKSRPRRCNSGRL